LGEFSNGRVQNVEAETRDVDVDVAVYEDTEFGGNDAQGIKYKMNGNTVYSVYGEFGRNYNGYGGRISEAIAAMKCLAATTTAMVYMVTGQ
jgi:hypothetical protein